MYEITRNIKYNHLNIERLLRFNLSKSYTENSSHIKFLSVMYLRTWTAAENMSH